MFHSDHVILVMREGRPAGVSLPWHAPRSRTTCGASLPAPHRADGDPARGEGRERGGRPARFLFPSAPFVDAKGRPLGRLAPSRIVMAALSGSAPLPRP